MKKYRSIIIYGGNGTDLHDAHNLHALAKQRNRSDIRILYYGLSVRGTCWDGSDASNRLCGIVEVDAASPSEVRRIVEKAGWYKVVETVDYEIAHGNFDKSATSIWTTARGWKSAKTKHLGTKHGVSCLYEFNAAEPEKPLGTVFTYGDKRKTVKAFNAELVGNVKATFAKDLSGTGIPQEFSIDANTVKVKLTKDGKARLCFAVHMKSSKKDFADVRLQTKINELRKEISFKYGVDIDIVDIRSTIEYV